MIETKELLPGITLRYYQDLRFKQGCLSLQIVRMMRQEEAAMNALIPAVLLRGTQAYPDLRSITNRLDELYGAMVAPMVRRFGDYQTTGIVCGFMDDRFAMAGDKVMEPMFRFAQEIMLESRRKDGAFWSEYVESEKKNLISTIESELNDKRGYAIGRLLRVMCREDSFGIPRLGDIEDVKAIEPGPLMEHYRKILRESPIELLYVGSSHMDRVATLLTDLFSRWERDYRPIPAQTGFHSCPGREWEEIMDVSQGKLCMGLTTEITNRHPLFMAMRIFNVLFGAGMTSKLFVNVREKQSLCYSIGSSYFGIKGILMVTAGIDFDQKQRTRDEILHQLELCRNGEITEQEVQAAREAMLSSFRATHDSPGAIEGFYMSSALSGMSLDPGAYQDAVRAVTREQVIEAAGTISLHSCYFLKGESQ